MNWISIVDFTIMMILIYLTFKISIVKYEKLLLKIGSISKRNIKNFRNNKSGSNNLRDKYGKFKLIYDIVYFFSVLILTFILSETMDLLSNLNFSIQKNTLFTIRVNYIHFSIGFLFLSLGLGFIVSEYVISLLLKDDFTEFQIYKNLKRGFLGTAKELKVIFILTFTSVFVLNFLLSNWYVKFNENDIQVNKFLSIMEKKYEYSDISYLRIAEKYRDKDGKSHNNLTMIIGFKDGKSSEVHVNSDNMSALNYIQFLGYKTDYGKVKNVKDEYNTILELLSKKTNITIEKQEYIESFS